MAVKILEESKELKLEKGAEALLEKLNYEICSSTDKELISDLYTELKTKYKKSYNKIVKYDPELLLQVKRVLLRGEIECKSSL